MVDTTGKYVPASDLEIDARAGVVLVLSAAVLSETVLVLDERAIMIINGLSRQVRVASEVSAFDSRRSRSTGLRPEYDQNLKPERPTSPRTRERLKHCQTAWLAS